MAVPVYTRASQKRTGPVDGQLAGLVCSHRREMIQELKGRAMVAAPLGIPGAGILGHIVNGFIGSAAVLAGIAGFFRTFVKGMESFICSFRMAGAFVAGQFPDAGIAASAVFAIIVTHSCNQYVFLCLYLFLRMFSIRVDGKPCFFAGKHERLVIRGRRMGRCLFSVFFIEERGCQPAVGEVICSFKDCLRFGFEFQ